MLIRRSYIMGHDFTIEIAADEQTEEVKAYSFNMNAPEGKDTAEHLDDCREIAIQLFIEEQTVSKPEPEIVEEDVKIDLSSREVKP